MELNFPNGMRRDVRVVTTAVLRETAKPVPARQPSLARQV